MSTVRLNPLDTAWVFTESPATPNHVGGLLQFRLPDDAPKDFLRRLMADFRRRRECTPPWNRRLRLPFNKNPLPVWVEGAVDLEYHVRHAALPWPGGERELGELVGRLQSTPLDLSRPPWECTLIEGLSGNRFALFVKIHHSLIDGVAGMKLLQRVMSTDRARSMSMPPFWACPPPPSPRSPRAGTPPSFAGVVATAVGALRGQVRSLPQLAAAFGKLLLRVGDPDEGLVVPFDSPVSVLNGRVRENRRFATQQFPLARLRAVAGAAGCTLNDVVLAVCAGALRRFLLERDSLPGKSLTAGIPVSVRPKDDEGGGNAISFIVATLGTDVDDPVRRLHAIRRSVQHAKAHLSDLPREAILQYTLVLMAPTVITLLAGIGGRTRPMFNITISNVPGPEKPLYFRGAELVATYPASIVTHGQALNITCQSYAGSMNFGFTGCHATVPSLQRVAVYTADALRELEAAVLPDALRTRSRTKGAGVSQPAGKHAGKRARKVGPRGDANADADAAPRPRTATRRGSARAAGGRRRAAG